MNTTHVRVRRRSSVDRQDHPRAQHGPHHGAGLVAECKRVAGHGARAQRKIVRRVGREGQRRIIVGEGGVETVGGGHVVGGHGDGDVGGESAGGSDVTGGAGAGKSVCCVLQAASTIHARIGPTG